ncbi:amidohydrolase family protein [Penicillium malachiteum]|uniref:amidohydrolase family protein n=1 Tax=Penicillium malachiteum TaxID=1324776 RepID=UPI0025489199|nr:amidohydrolase family protein [Penicillium malachiteum]KAJ5731704.1 amidohydrolase family protein [Penicillium malachiteum]
MSTPIVDSHIHLFPESHLPTLAWHGPNNPLGSQHCINEYRDASSSVSTTATPETKHYLQGFIFLETDRISSISEESTENPGWKHALDEVSLLTRIALGEPIPGEGHKAIDRDLCLGIIPWAPVPGGPNVLRKYLSQVQERTRTDEVWRKVRGVRYLVQDKAAGVMLESDFVNSLRFLGKEGLVFDLGVDARQGGLHQLREAVEMMDRVYEGVEDESQVTIVINHLCKPNLRLPSDSTPTHNEYLEWKDLITRMARASNRTYMKLSGGFSELPSLTESEIDLPSVIDTLQPWTDAVFDTFGADRVMFGSDWPVCNVGGGGNEVSWSRWRSVVEGILERRGLTEDEKKGVWGNVAVEAYGISI